MTDPGCHYSGLAKFRKRLLAGQTEQVLLVALLDRFQACGLLTAGGRARTDSTHIVAAVRVTETCDDDTRHVIPHVETTEVAVPDVAMTAPIQRVLCQKHRRIPAI